jgi:hypothetical protein
MVDGLLVVDGFIVVDGFLVVEVGAAVGRGLYLNSMQGPATYWFILE